LSKQLSPNKQIMEMDTKPLGQPTVKQASQTQSQDFSCCFAATLMTILIIWSATILPDIHDIFARHPLVPSIVNFSLIMWFYVTCRFVLALVSICEKKHA